MAASQARYRLSEQRHIQLQPAVLLGWIAQSGRPLVGMALLTSFGIGQVVSLLIAGTFAAAVPKLLALRSVGRWVPPISGVVLLSTGLLTLIAR